MTQQEWGRKINEISYEAQRAILSDNLSPTRKDFIVDEAVKQIKVIQEERAKYFGKHGEGRRTRKRK